MKKQPTLLEKIITIAAIAICLLALANTATGQTNRLHTINTDFPLPCYQMILIHESMRSFSGIDTIPYDNHNYIYRVVESPDSLLDEIIFISSYRLYRDNFKAAGSVYFLAHFAGMIVAPQTNLQPDKYLHFAAGYVTGAGVNYLVYKWTGKKWLAFAAGVVAGGVVGGGKELFDKYHGGTVSFNDGLATGLGGLDGSGGATIVFGHKERAKQFINP